MKIQKLLLAIPLLFLAAATTPSVTAQAAAGSSPTSMPRPDHGPLAGGWRLPMNGNPGHLRGKLVTRNGHDVFRIEGRIDRNAPGRPQGVLRGHATLLNGPRAGTRFPLVGTWMGTGAGTGTFRAKILRKRSQGQKAKALVDLRGGYIDLDPLKPRGVFRGHWARKS